MKKISITLAIVGTIFIIISCSNCNKNSKNEIADPKNNKSEDTIGKVKNIGAIGDVKYSVLPPMKFKEKNGNGWVLMDDKIPLRGSDLGGEGILELPDARGMFIRGLNVKRSDDKADPYQDEHPKKKERGVGDYQIDDFKSHNHDLTFAPQTGNFYGPRPNFEVAWVGRNDIVAINNRGGE